MHILFVLNLNFSTKSASAKIELRLVLKQELLFHSTTVVREFTHIAYTLLFSRRSDCDEYTY